MPSESHLYVYTWEKVAEYSPFYNNRKLKDPARIVRDRFGKEMQRLNVVHKGRRPGDKSPHLVIYGLVWRIEKYFHLKQVRGELYKRKKGRFLLLPLQRSDIERKV